MTARRKGWTRNLRWTAAFSIALVVVTAEFAKAFAYMGYVSRNYTLWDLLTSTLAAFILALTLPHRWRFPSHFAYAFLVATIGIPVIVIPVFWGPLSSSLLTLTQTVTLASFCLTRVGMIGARRRMRLPIVSAQLYWAVVTLLAVVTVWYLFISTGISPTFLSLSDVYDQRLEFNSSASTVASYAVGWVGGGVMPAVLAAGLFCRSLPLILGSVVGVTLLYTLTGHKSFLVGIALTIAAYYLCRGWRRFGSSWLITFSCIVLGSALLDRLTRNIIFKSLLVRRALSTAGLNTSLYFDYFDQADKYELRHSVLSILGPSPYKVSPARLIGATFYHSETTSANANLIADGFANFGVLGCLLAGVGLGLCLRFYDKIALGLPLEISGPAMIPVLIALANTAPLTVLATHGGLILALFIALMPRRQTDSTVGHVKPTAEASALSGSEPLVTNGLHPPIRKLMDT